MKQRLLVALLVLPPVLLGLWGGAHWWALVILIVSTLGGLEYFALMAQGGYQPYRLLGMGWLLLLIVGAWQPTLLPLSLVITVGFIATFTQALFKTERPILNWAITGVGALYIGAMLGQAISLRLLPNGLAWVFLSLAVTMLNDTFAFFIGITFGKHKIWPRLSPKKSWEGTIGGWIAAAVTGYVVVSLTPIPLAPWIGAVVGLMGGILALLGDLTISMLKRQVGAKDSGKIMPGHGGMLDRLDSLLFVIPFIYQVALLALAAAQ
ncbi:MAG: phosphatidate cytidylyltransferase [Caldilineaceae bacterium]|nr:phosphatidate cytidylyltransferase [Caldilineaceae bacterium]